jgi:Ca-activated chloride channel family protein
MQKITVIIALLVVAVATPFIHLNAPVARADGIIIPEPPICLPPCPVPPPPPQEVPYLTVQNHRVNVTINDQVATTRVDQVFRNDSQWSLEGTYIFPLPENAAISEFNMWINGEKVEGQLYTKEEARRIYDNIVRRRLDPALLEYVGRDLFQASIFPIDPGDTRRVEIEYTQLLPIDNGLVHYVYPLSTEKFSAQPLENVAVTVDISTSQPLKAIYSPSHAVGIQRDGRTQAHVGWEDANVLPNTDFSLYYTVSPEDVGASLLSTHPSGGDGFFTLLVAPDVDAGQVVEKDVILVLDVSGSMEGEKMEQARDALIYVLDHLNPADRFNVIAFSTGARAFANMVQPAGRAAEARRFVADLYPEGSTDINRALLEAIDSTGSDRPTIIIFLTDGLPTSGVVETPLILNNIRQAATANLRIFPFGVGDDVDTLLLDSLARENRGASAYVRPGERVDEQVSTFFARVSTPVLTDLNLQVDGVAIEDTYPYPLPDLFAGSQLIVTGRYRSGGPASITLSGLVNGQPRAFRYDDLRFATSGNQQRNDAGFIPRLWATRKIGHLLNQMRLNGETREIIDEVVALSIRYGIITPYTSFLVEEPELALSDEGRQMIVEEEYAAAEAAPPAAVSGDAAVDKAVEQNALAGADMAAPPPTAAGSAIPESSQAAVTTVGQKAFVLRDGIWIDTTYNPDTMTATQLLFPSDDFMAFLANNPDTGQYFALGPQVIVVAQDGRVYQSIPGDAGPIPDKLDPATLQSQPIDAPETLAAPSAAINLTLTADFVSGPAPLAINLTATLSGGADDNPDFYCQPITFDFGNGLSRSAAPRCAEWQPGAKILRDFNASTVYGTPGQYQVTFRLGDAEAEPLLITVTADGAAVPGEPAATLVADNPAPTDPPTVSVLTNDTAGTPGPSTGRAGAPNCLPGFLLLPLFAAAVGIKATK